MSVVAIIQARMKSTRLPGKVLKDIGGETMLARVVNRVRRAKLVDKVVVAMPTSEQDIPIVEECGRIGVTWYRGSEDDVLDRYLKAAVRYNAETIVRVTADCPFVDPDVIDVIGKAFLRRYTSYVSNTIKRSYPRGLDVEFIKLSALFLAWQGAKEQHEREHVTPYIYEHRERFSVMQVTDSEWNLDKRWTVDTPEDLEFSRAVYAKLGNRDDFSWLDVLKIVKADPSLEKINAHVNQKTLAEA